MISLHQYITSEAVRAYSRCCAVRNICSIFGSAPLETPDASHPRTSHMWRSYKPKFLMHSSLATLPRLDLESTSAKISPINCGNLTPRIRPTSIKDRMPKACLEILRLGSVIPAAQHNGGEIFRVVFLWTAGCPHCWKQPTATLTPQPWTKNTSAGDGLEPVNP